MHKYVCTIQELGLTRVFVTLNEPPGYMDNNQPVQSHFTGKASKSRPKISKPMKISIYCQRKVWPYCICYKEWVYTHLW